MPLYTVLAPPVRDGETAPDPMDCVFVKEGFSWPALFVPELWLLFRRMWFVFLVYVVANVVVIVIDGQVGGPLPGVFLVFAHLWFALEGNALRRWTLVRRGHRIVDVVEGGRLAAAEVRFFHERAPPQRDPTQPSPERLEATLRQQSERLQAQLATGSEPGERQPAASEPMPPTTTTPSPPAKSRPFRETPDGSPSPEREPVVGLFPERSGGT